MLAGTGHDLELGPEQFRRLRDIIYEKSGIFFAENKLYLLENRQGCRINDLGMYSFDEYIRHVRSQDGSAPEFHQSYNAVNIIENVKLTKSGLTKVEDIEGIQLRMEKLFESWQGIGEGKELVRNIVESYIQGAEEEEAIDTSGTVRQGIAVSQADIDALSGAQ